MAVADASQSQPSPPPPPAGIVVVVLAFVRFAPAPMLTPGRLLDFALEALPYLCFAVAWVMSAASAAKIAARRAWGEASAPFLLLEAFTHGAFTVLACIVLVLLALAILMLCGLCVAYVIAAVSGSGSEFNQRASGAITRNSAASSFKLPRAALLGFMADLPLSLLVFAGLVVAAMSHVEGSVSQGEMVGLVIADVGTFAMHAIPALALDVWREDRADRTAPSQFC